MRLKPRREGTSHVIDVPVAMLAAAAAGIMAFAALAPGAARTAAAILAAVAAAAGAFRLLRWLDRFGDETAKERDAVPVRRRDSHPDASVRAPLSASRELGEPTPAPRPSRWRAWLPSADPTVPVAPGGEVGRMMRRLEQGFGRRYAALARALDATEKEPAAAPDERLRRAMEHLDRLAG